jgi:hypothetical protein
MKTANIYDQHSKAFDRVSAYVLADHATGEQVGTVAFKYPADGAGRVYCYLHIHGLPMMRGCATGYGYDKTTAAFEAAASKAQGVPDSLADCGGDGWQDRARCYWRVMRAV